MIKRFGVQIEQFKKFPSLEGGREREGERERGREREIERERERKIEREREGESNVKI